MKTSQSNNRFVASLPLAVVAICAALPGVSAAKTVDEIKVTATRRVTDLQSTPVAVTALDEDAIRNLFAHDIGEIALVTPNFSAAQITGFNAAGFAMRGQAQTDILVYWEPPVGVVVDDFVVPHMQTQLLEPFDLESVEVLRGPQGTLFGKNTTAGVVNVRTKRPVMNEFGLDASLLAGSYGRIEGRAAINVPIVDDTLAFRLAAFSQNSDGYYKNGKASPAAAPGPVIGNGEDIGGDDAIAARAKLLWTPTEDLKIMFQYEYLKDDGDSPPAVNETDPNAPQAWNALGFPGVSGGDPIDQAGVTFRDDGLNMRGGHQIDVDGYYLNIDWGVGDYDVTFVGGYREQESRLPSTYTGEVFASLFDASRDDDRETTQVELRVASNYDGAFNFVTGLFYQTDETSFNVLQYLGLLDLFGASVPGVLDNDNPLYISNNQDMDSIAGFFDATYEINDTWTVAAGLRYTREEKEFFSRPGTPIVVYGASVADLPFDANDTNRFPCRNTLPMTDPSFNAFDCQTDKEEWNEPTYRLMVSNQISDNLFGYLSYAHGFKSGGYSDQAGSGLNAPLALTRYEPEEADSIEIGLKADLLDDRLRINSAIFYAKYEDMQRAAIAQQGAFQETVVFNAAEVPAYGLEVEGTYVVTDNLTLRGNFGYLDAEYDEFQLDLDLDGVNDQDLSGRDVTRAPEFMFGLDATWEQPISDVGNLRAIAGVYYEDGSTYYYAADGEQFDTEIQSHAIYNASVTFTSADDLWFVSVFGKNLSDKRYRNASQYVGGLWTFATYAEPRVFGVEAGVKL